MTATGTERRVGVSVFDYLEDKYECPECGGKTKMSPRPHKAGEKQHVYVDHKGGCETGIRNRMLATRNQQGAIKNAN